LWILASYWRIICPFTQNVALFLMFDISKICMFVLSRSWVTFQVFSSNKSLCLVGFTEIHRLRISTRQHIRQHEGGLLNLCYKSESLNQFLRSIVCLSNLWVHHYEFVLVQHFMFGAIRTYGLFFRSLYIYFSELYFSLRPQPRCCLGLPSIFLYL
jgi:hypothetical protein